MEEARGGGVEVVLETTPGEEKGGLGGAAYLAAAGVLRRKRCTQQANREQVCTGANLTSNVRLHSAINVNTTSSILKDNEPCHAYKNRGTCKYRLNRRYCKLSAKM